MTKKQLLAGVLMAGVSTMGLIGLASAATGDKPASLAATLATKFHLNQSEVQAVIDQHHDQMHSFREQAYEDRLDQAVKDGELTTAQKDQIVAKHQELATFMESLKDKTPEERRAAIKAKLSELHQWAKDNDISPWYLMGLGLGHGHGHGFGKPNDMHQSDQS